MPQTLPVVLTIAGSDNSAGAGLQADLKTFSALQVYGVTAVTCIVAEVPGKVSAIQPVDGPVLAEQIRLLFEAYPIAAVKTGMLFSRELIATVCDTLEECFARSGSRPPLVVDPVMVATSGDLLLQQDAIALYCERLFPLAQIITPNLDETSALSGRAITTATEMEAAGRELVQRHRTAFLLKGGHLAEDVATDVLLTHEGARTTFSAPFVRGVSTHGTGCTYSAAIAAELGRGRSLEEAVRAAKTYITRAITQFLRWEHHGHRTDALHHFATDAAAQRPT